MEPYLLGVVNYSIPAIRASNATGPILEDAYYRGSCIFHVKVELTNSMMIRFNACRISQLGTTVFLEV